MYQKQIDSAWLARNFTPLIKSVSFEGRINQDKLCSSYFRRIQFDHQKIVSVWLTHVLSVRSNQFQSFNCIFTHDGSYSVQCSSLNCCFILSIDLHRTVENGRCMKSTSGKHHPHTFFINLKSHKRIKWCFCVWVKRFVSHKVQKQ